MDVVKAYMRLSASVQRMRLSLRERTMAGRKGSPRVVVELLLLPLYRVTTHTTC